MIRVACVGLWLALAVSFAVSASIIGMPAKVVAFEIVRASLWTGILIGVVFLARAALLERDGNDGTGSSA
jgi:hypothetical protein